jgi:hypothetical protein
MGSNVVLRPGMRHTALESKPKDGMELGLALAIEREAVKTIGTDEFIRLYCWIESKDEEGGGSAVRFELWEAQKRVLKQMDAGMTIVLKARQLGLTWLAVCKIVHMVLARPGYTAIVLSQRKELAAELVWRVKYVLERLPKWMVLSLREKREYERERGRGSYTGIWYEASKSVVTVHHAGVEESRVRAESATLSAARSLTADFLLFDEWAFHGDAQGIWTAAYPTVNRPGSGVFVGISTNKRGSLFEYMWKNATKLGFEKVFLGVFTDPRRTQGWYERTKLALGDKVQQEYPLTEEEALRAGENTAFPEWAEIVHVCDDFAIPDGWRRFAAVDNGYTDPFFWAKFAISPDGVVYMYYEYTRDESSPRMVYSDQARRFASDMVVQGDDGGLALERLDYIVAGTDAWNQNVRDASGKNLIDYYREGGLDRQTFIMATTNRQMRKFVMHEYLKPLEDENAVDETGRPRLYARLQVFRSCTSFIAQMPQLVCDERRVDVVADIDDHGYDAGGYAILSLHLRHSPQQGVDERTEIQRHKDSLIHGNRRRRWRGHVSSPR